MRKELLDMIEVLANEKNVSKDIVIAALESAMAGAVKKSARFENEDPDIIAKINPATGDYKIWRRWTIVPDEQGIQEPDREILEWEAKEDYADQENIAAGGFVLDELTDVNITGRRFAMDAKQVIMLKLREAERAQILDEFLAHNKDKKIVRGQVKAMPKGDAIIEIGRLEARLPRSEMLEGSRPLRVGDQVRAYIKNIDLSNRQQQITLSRRCDEFLLELLRLEVPEIDQGFMEIKGCAREPGKKAKVAVLAKDKRIDPLGTCIGVKGQRISAVQKELNNERVEIILWSDQPIEYVINAMAPAKVLSVVCHEDQKRMEVVVADSEEGKAIGSNGDNARLASKLTGWDIQVLTPKEADEKRSKQQKEQVDDFVKYLEIDEDVAKLLIEYGFETLEEVAYYPEEELLKIEELEPEDLKEIRSRARTALLTLAIDREEALKSISEDVMNLADMDHDTAYKLFQHDIKTLDQLADLSSDELIDIASIGQEQAEKIIKEARAHWDEK